MVCCRSDSLELQNSLLDNLHNHQFSTVQAPREDVLVFEVPPVHYDDALYKSAYWLTYILTYLLTQVYNVCYKYKLKHLSTRLEPSMPLSVYLTPSRPSVMSIPCYFNADWCYNEKRRQGCECIIGLWSDPHSTQCYNRVVRHVAGVCCAGRPTRTTSTQSQLRVDATTASDHWHQQQQLWLDAAQTHSQWQPAMHPIFKRICS